MGRNIFQSDAPVAMMQAVQGVVHGGLNAEQGFAMYNDLKSKKA
jgi:putative autoinducer-2 (AI-2) aldolase